MKHLRSRHCLGLWSIVGLGSIAFAAPANAQNPPSTFVATDQPPQEVVVTGSRIPTVTTDITPDISVITSKDLDDRGFRNAFDALNTLTQNTGFTQGADFGNTYTPAANTISLRGLGPNHTLILINGQRVADYPVPYDGAVNFVNLANIPTAAIDRIEILNGGASAIYGSDAIAGVVNVILKDHAKGLDVDLKGGMTQQGGGGNGRFQASGGKLFGDLSTTFALEISRVEPIWAESRDFMTSTTLQGGDPAPMWSRQDLTTDNSITPPGNCAPFARGFQNSTALDSTGSFCGSGKVRPTFWSVQTGNQAENLYGNVKYELNDHAHFFGDVLLGWNHIWNDTRGPSWVSDKLTNSYFLNQNTGDYESWSRFFSPEEIGGVDRFNQHWNDFSAILTLGVGGDIAGSWKYTGTYNGSVYTSHNARPLVLSSVDNYFLGPQLGTDSSGVAIYAPDPARFNQPLTPTQFNQIAGQANSTNNSWLHTIGLNANGELFNLPAGAVGAAGTLEWGSQGYTNHPDPGLNEGLFYNQAGTNPASGTRTRYAAAVEFRIPILKDLSARLATRYDEYSFEERKEGKPTYNASIDYRPINQLRIHGSYATSFRAPDMNYIFQSKSHGYFATTTDYYLCSLGNQPLSSCPYTNYSPGANYTQLGSQNLGFEQGRSFNYGIVITPIEQIQLSADYWNIRIDNEVTLIDSDQLVRTDSACLLGQLDANSSQCTQAVTAVARNPAGAILNPNAITNITIYPINAAYERTDGIDIAARVRWKIDGIGNFLWSTNYTKVMSHYYQQGPGDTPLDLVHSFDNPNGTPDFPEKLTSTLQWSLGDLSSTVEVDRFGSIANEALTGYLTPTSLVNWSASYKFGNATVGVIIDNVFDTIKKDDSAGWPYYAVGYYLPYGRQGWLEVSYHFGS